MPLCVGREDETRALVADLLHGSSPIAVTGPAGIGKATLLLAALHHPELEARYGDRRIFVRCDGARSFDALLVVLARALGLEPWQDLEDRLLKTLEKAPAVLALADLDVPWAADPERTEALLAHIGTLHDLALAFSVTGDELPAGPASRPPLCLGPLEQPAARDLFLTLAGPRFQDDPCLDPLLNLVDRAPLAVSVLARAARSEPSLSVVCERWQTCRDQRAARLRWQGVQEWLLHVEVPLEVVLTGPGMMTPDALRLLSLLADLPDGVRLEDVPRLLPVEADVTPTLLDAGLAFEEHGRLRVLAPVREEVKREHPPDEADLDRAVAFYLARGTAAEWTEEPGNIHAMLLLGLESSDPEPALRAALPLCRMERDARGEAHCLRRLGDTALERDDLEAARLRYEEALPVYHRLRDPSGEANCLRSLGDIAAIRMEFTAALGRYSEATALFHRAGNLQGEAHCLRAQGDLALVSNDLDGARDCYREALAIYRRIGDLLGQANCLQREGDLAVALSDACAAHFRYEEALSLCEKIREPYSLGLIHVRLALMMKEGSPERRQHVEAARESWQGIGRTDLMEILEGLAEAT
ncbi:MAG TPA: hypothetical protein VH394_19035 [Thermoanaerobaculia bacterium]|jgi:tetratricopeptide (TPR) repeat protein|nr:hypothetical protein [Thermoanaerobaculia bacterium]